MGIYPINTSILEFAYQLYPKKLLGKLIFGVQGIYYTASRAEQGRKLQVKIKYLNVYYKLTSCLEEYY